MANCPNSTDKTYDFVIIGGGASGLTAAVSFLCAGGSDVLIVDRKEEPGKKILATGNGRCNITNQDADGCAYTTSFFRDLGMFFYTDEAGRVYPMGRQAGTVRDALVNEAIKLGAEFSLNTQTTEIRIDDEGMFVLSAANESAVKARRVLIAAGGSAGPQYGSAGDSFRFARQFGHSVRSILPVLVPVVYADDVKSELKRLKGVRSDALCRLFYGDEQIYEERGEVQFTALGLSGICIFNLSRYLRSLADCHVTLDLAPDLGYDDLSQMLSERRSAGIGGIVNDKLAAFIRDKSSEDIKLQTELIKGFDVKIAGTLGWREAQVTSGGVPLSEVDEDTMESKIVPGLFFAGEVLDYDGPSGGYNLDFAWNTGMRAGRGAANQCLE